MADRERIVGIDELLDLGGEPILDEEEPLPGRAQRFGGRWWLRKVAEALGTSAVVWGLAYLVRIFVPYPLITVVVLALSVLRHGLLEVRDEPLPADVSGRGLPPPADEADLGGPGGGLRISVQAGDGLRYAIGRWDERLVWAERDGSRFGHLVVPRLADIVDERLRQRHGISRTNEPERARALLGEDLWTLLRDPPARVPDPRALASIVAKVEEL
jgi:hypothetical protein